MVPYRWENGTVLDDANSLTLPNVLYLRVKLVMEYTSWYLGGLQERLILCLSIFVAERFSGGTGIPVVCNEEYRNFSPRQLHVAPNTLYDLL